MLLGVAYKRDINDCRETPALGIIEQLQHKGAIVTYHDPFVPEVKLETNGSLTSATLTDELLAGCDCVVIVTDHSGVDYAEVVRLAPLIVDTRNITRRLGMPEHDAKIVRL